HKIVHRVVGIDGLTRIAPEAVYHVVLHVAVTYVVIIDIRDLELPAAGWLKRRDDIKDSSIIKIHTGHGERARRLFRLLYDTLDPAIAIEGSDTQVAEVCYVIEP